MIAKTHTIFFLLLIIVSASGYGQKAIMDSLEKQISGSGITDAAKIIPLSQQAIYYRSISYHKALESAQEALKLAKRQKDKKYSLYAYAALASVYGYADSIGLCYRALDTCMQYMEKTADIEAKVSALNRVAVNRMMFDDRTEVLHVLDQAYRLLEGQVHYELEAEVCYSMYCYYSYSDVANTGKYANLSLVAALKSANPRLIVQSWNALGHYYQEVYELKSDVLYLDSAIYVLSKSLGVSKENKGYVTDVDHVLTFINLSSAYDHKNKVHHVYTDSIIYYAAKALSLSKEINDAQLQAYAYDILSAVALNANRIEKAEELLLEASAVVEKYDYSQTKYSINTSLSNLYEQKGEYKEALKYLKSAQENFMKANDVVYMKEGQLLAAKYEFEKKEQALRFKQKEKNLYVGIAVFLLLGIISLVLFFTYRIKYMKQKEIILEQEKQEASLLAKLKAAETKRLQHEVVVGNMQLNYKNELLDNILKNSTIDKALVERIRNKELKIDNSFDDFRTELKEIHPEFYMKLQHKANQKLTSLDLKYCVCIFMKMSSKEIAELFHVEATTVRMTKYRLKQKLYLSKEEDLSKFIGEII